MNVLPTATRDSMLVAMCVVAVAFPASAQESDATTQSAETVYFMGDGQPAVVLGATVDFVAGVGSVLGEVIENRPYSADAVTETTQVLADGNRIVRRNEARVYRDSEGRVRREQTVNSVGVWQAAGSQIRLITITDPVAKVSYSLDPVTAVAHELPLLKLALDGAEWGSGVRLSPPPGSIDEATIATTESIAELELEPGSIEATPGIRVGGATAGDSPAGGPLVQGTIVGTPVAIEARSEDLGEKVIQGVLAQGTRETQTIPTGAIGNTWPIETVVDRWYSSELQVEMERRTFDPRFGETVFRLLNVVLGEPPPDLFVVPNSYTLQRIDSTD